jgi:predicted transcriptional regulator
MDTMLIAKSLIVQDVSSSRADGVVYRTTEKGREFLLYYTRLIELLEEEKEKQQKLKVELSAAAPYISSSNRS